MDGFLDIGAAWLDLAQAELSETIALRRAIHAEPEIGLHCPKTTSKIKTALEGLPLEYRQGPSTSGLVAVLRGGGNGRTVLLRGDMDALPMQEETGLPFSSGIDGAMHACGHDAHTAMLVGAAKALCARRDSLAGAVVFMFQPGEEGWHGARYMMEDGLLEDPAPEAAFALHVAPNVPRGVVTGRAGPALASADTLSAIIEGRGGHAAMPHEALDPIPVACEIVLALQSFITRQIPVFDPAVLTITKITAGTAHNIIPGRAEILGTVRTLSESTRSKTHAAFLRIVSKLAEAHGLTARPHVEPGFPVTVNDPRALALAQRCAKTLGGDSGWITMSAPLMGAEDFSYVLQKIPGAMTFLGVAPESVAPEEAFPLHNTRMTLDEATLAKGIAMHALAAETFLSCGFEAPA